jgi:hypothetical protein
MHLMMQWQEVSSIVQKKMVQLSPIEYKIKARNKINLAELRECYQKNKLCFIFQAASPFIKFCSNRIISLHLTVVNKIFREPAFITTTQDSGTQSGRTLHQTLRRRELHAPDCPFFTQDNPSCNSTN